MLDVGMHRAELAEQLRDRFAIGARFQTPEFSSVVAALFPDKPASRTRADHDRSHSFSSEALLEIAEVTFRPATAAMADHEENAAIIMLPGTLPEPP
jgi:hypothetical protein